MVNSPVPPRGRRRFPGRDTAKPFMKLLGWALVIAAFPLTWRYPLAAMGQDHGNAIRCKLLVADDILVSGADGVLCASLTNKGRGEPRLTLGVHEEGAPVNHILPRRCPVRGVLLTEPQGDTSVFFSYN